MRYEINGKKPTLHETASIAPGARVIGDVVMAASSSIWFNAVVRADDNRISIGPGSNIQDNAVLHVDATHPLTIGANVTIGHGAIVHGCTIEDGVLIGMGAIVLDGAYIEKGSLIAAGALVKQDMRVPAGSLVAGVPGKVIRTLDAKDAEFIAYPALVYRERGLAYRALVPLDQNGE
jgi:carbonic anhydrase/acetyltransferase-like protein (isoleucine patch superfamily)